MPQLTQPNHFEIKGQGIAISYSTSGIAAKPLLSLQKGQQKLNFTGDEIGTVSTTIGTLVTVTIAKTVDRGSTALSFLIPGIQLPESPSKQSFRTIGVTTVEKTTIAGPVKGPQQTYKVTQLTGTATQVESVKHRTAGA